MAMKPTSYSELMRVARRHSRRSSEAEDLVQDALLAAVASGRDPGDPATRPWLAGAIRRRAAFLARGAFRRLRREGAWHEAEAAETVAAEALHPAAFLAGLPPSLKAVAALALSGHSRPEIRYLLGIGDTALRQRLVALKRKLAARRLDMPATTPGLTLELDYGRIRDALFGKLVREGGLFASHDPDGHLFVVRRSQTAGRRQQESGTSSRSTP
jgi:RNA polymerase sigma-70 factor (ECF subfamily)